MDRKGRPLLYNGQNITGRGPVRFAGASYFREGGAERGCGPALQRLREQDDDGIDAEIYFQPVFATQLIEGIANRDVHKNRVLAEPLVVPDRDVLADVT